jgi:hypothetical protein
VTSVGLVYGERRRKVEQYFVNVLSAGLGGLVDRYVDTVPLILEGRAGIYLSALRLWPPPEESLRHE